LFGYDDKLSFKPESLFALQISSDLGDGLSATAQIMSRGENDYSANFEWAYLSYEISDNSQINAGRLRIPFYRYSDFLDVGYAYNWNRPPSSVYNSDFSSFDGLSYVYSSSLGVVDSSVQLIAGSHSGGEEGNRSSFDSLVAVNWTLTYDWLTARVAYFSADVSFDIASDGLKAIIEGFKGAEATTPAANNLLIEDDFGSFLGFGLSVDYNDFLFETEVITSQVENSVIAEQSSYYLMFGYRINEWTVLATLENRKDEADSANLGQLGGAIDGIYKSLEFEQDVVSVGARYNFHPSAALKFDYTSTEVGDADAVNVLSVGVDLVF
jgi:hypothetical protein